MRAAELVLYFCLAFAGGILLASFWHLSQQLLLAFFILGLISICVFRRKKVTLMGFCLIFFAFGILRFQIAESRLEKHILTGYYGEKITLTGRIAKEPDVRESYTKITVGAEILELNGAPQDVGGAKVLVTVKPYPEYKYGDCIRLTGELQAPADSGEFNYKKYLSAQGIVFVMNWPIAESLPWEKTNFASAVFIRIMEFKKAFRTSIEQNISPPESTILSAMIFGDQGSGHLSKDWSDKLNRSGLRHITAISGMNITIISQMLFALGLAFGLWRGQAFYFALIILFVYIFIVGAPASAVRAGIMGGLFLLAQKVGRPANAGRAIVFAGTGMIILNPFLLTRDIGFQLSFLAMMGMVYLMPSIQRWIGFIPNPALLPVRSLCAMTLAAQIFTLPILIYNFGQISVAAPLANILVVPLLPIITVLGFVAGVAGMLWQPLGWFLAWPIWLLMAYMVKIIDVFSSLPFAFWQIKNVSWFFLPFVYALLTYFVVKLQHKERFNFLG